MIKDITFGQFIDTNSAIHRLDPRTKLVLLIAFMIFLLFFVKSFLSMGIFALFGSLRAGAHLLAADCSAGSVCPAVFQVTGADHRRLL